MRSNNPVFRRSAAFANAGGQGYAPPPTPSPGTLEEMYSRPAATPAGMGRMTVDDVVMRFTISLGVLVVGAGFAWFVAPGLALVGAIGGLVLGLVISFKQSTNPAMILAYAGLEGLFVGGISHFYNDRWNGIVAQAVIGTLLAAGATVAVYKSGRLRVTPKFTRIVVAAGLAYLGVALVSFATSLAGVNDGWGLRVGPLGIVLGLIGATLACAFLVMDLDFVEQGVRNGLPERYAWLGAFGLLATLVWLYVEILRLISILRR